MSETYTGPTPPDDIEADPDTASTVLDREADAILVEGRTFARPLRRAVREDAAQARAWARARATRLRGAVQAEPVRATLYALGLGVLIGLLVAR
jgi:hypothetical protein